jgi:hypothetical protein
MVMYVLVPRVCAGVVVFITCVCAGGDTTVGTGVAGTLEAAGIGTGTAGTLDDGAALEVGATFDEGTAVLEVGATFDEGTAVLEVGATFESPLDNAYATLPLREIRQRKPPPIAIADIYI